MTLFHNKIFQLVVLLVSLGLCLSAGGTIVDLWHRRDLVRMRQHDLQKITKENEALERELREANSESYVERIARDKLGLVRDGESIVLLQQAQNGNTGNMGNNKAMPNWQKWWKLFF